MIILRKVLKPRLSERLRIPTLEIFRWQSVDMVGGFRIGQGSEYLSQIGVGFQPAPLGIFHYAALDCTAKRCRALPKALCVSMRGWAHCSQAWSCLIAEAAA